MNTHVLQAEILKPKALDPTAWAAIRDCFDRLQGAVRANDRPLAIGSAKDLVEATARVVLDSRGQPAGSNEEYDKVLNLAHRAIEYQPGPGLSPDAAVRQAANSAKKLAAQLRELRNSYGTGHGRSTLPLIEDEVIETCVDGALLWTRWALRRLQFLIIGSVQQLVTDLHSSTFSTGDLATRLQAADLPRLPFENQRRLGGRLANVRRGTRSRSGKTGSKPARPVKTMPHGLPDTAKEWPNVSSLMLRARSESTCTRSAPG
ncbi:abortive infection family protein [Streptomyces olivaceus]|uniref:abortive infection family protein n=1 Tax=Streptomyces olivaceus TaxID=47716 RepID=UPI0033E02556